MASLPRLEVRRRWVYKPAGAWSYSHHPHLGVFGGTLFAIWSNGLANEDDCGQRILISRTADLERWSAPVPLLTPGEWRSEHGVLTAGGLHAHAGGLTAFAGYFEYDHARFRSTRRPPTDNYHCRRGLIALASRDGEYWEPPLDLGIPFVPNHGPQRTASGRLILSGGISFPHSMQEDGLGGWSVSAIVPPELLARYGDDSAAFEPVRQAMGWPAMLCEGAFYQTDDGVLHMLLRSNTERLWVTESVDDGESWSRPVPTGFSDNRTKFHFGRLPDGRFYYVGNPDPARPGARASLVVSTSADGVSFDRHWVIADDPYTRRYDGLHKLGQYGYPHSAVFGDRLCVAVSRMKEALEVIDFPLAALAQASQ